MLPCSRIASASFSLGLDPPKECRTRPRAPDLMFAAHQEQERSIPPSVGSCCLSSRYLPVVVGASQE